MPYYGFLFGKADEGESVGRTTIYFLLQREAACRMRRGLL